MSDQIDIGKEAVPEGSTTKRPRRKLSIHLPDILSALELESVTALGWLPALSLVMAFGIALIAIGCSGSRMNANWAQPVFWSGFLTLIIPPGLRLCMKEPSRRERLILLTMLAVGYYLIKVFYSPLIFNLNDELQHWRSTYNILQTHQLFQENPSLRVSAYFPGLETVTDAIVNVTGLSIVQAGQVLVGLVFITIPITLFLLFERVSYSSYLAGIASLVYFGNPSYLLGYSQFSYEGLAVALSFLAIYLIVIQVQHSHSYTSISLIFAVVLLLAAVIITHHMTSYWLSGLLMLWAAIAVLRRNPEEYRAPLIMFALLAVDGCILWLLETGNIQLIIGYIDAPMIKAINGMVGIFTGSLSPRTFFQGQGGSGVPTPLWMQIPSYLSVGIISLSTLLGLWVLRSISKIHALAITFGLLSLGYFVAQATRISASGLVMTDRIASVIFFPLSFVVAHGITRAIRFFQSPAMLRLWRPIVTACVCLILVGSATAVVANRELPGAYKPYVFSRDINTLGIATAGWAKDTLGPGHRVGADFINMLIMGSYGDQQVVTEENGFFAETTVFASNQIDQAEIDDLKRMGVEYLVIDNNLENQLVLPQTPGAVTYLTTLDSLDNVSRIYDSGSITIYHLGFVSPTIVVNPASPAQH